MINTYSLFEERKREVEFYFSIMYDIENNPENIRTIDNTLFLRILKSNFLLMLYNLVEACFVSGMVEIYDKLKNSNSCYTDLIYEIRSIWSNFEIGKVYSNSAARSSYENRVKEMIEHVIDRKPIILNREAMGINGNLDARAIKRICDQHRIRYVAEDKDGCLRLVKEKRNSLAHGDESFGDSARDMTLADLEHIKDEVINFIKSILDGMNEYFENQSFLLSKAN